MTTSTISLIPNANQGNVTYTDGTTAITDILPVQSAKLSFPNLTEVMFFLQEFTLPDISIGIDEQPTPYVDLKHVGEKVVYSNWDCTFKVDKFFNNWGTVFNWMKSITVDGSAIDNTSNPVLYINNTPTLQYMNAFPVGLSGSKFASNEQGMMYVTANMTIAYDYINFLGYGNTIDSSYN